MKNRSQRRAEKSAFTKELRTAVFDAFEDKTIYAKESGVKFPTSMGNLIGFYKNSIYSVQVYQELGIKKLGIRRHDQKASCPWNHKQAIKNHILGDDAYAIEIFPPIEKLTDQANMYWLWSSGSIDEACKQTGGLGK